LCFAFPIFDAQPVRGFAYHVWRHHLLSDQHAGQTSNVCKWLWIKTDLYTAQIAFPCKEWPKSVLPLSRPQHSMMFLAHIAIFIGIFQVGWLKYKYIIILQSPIDYRIVSHHNCRFGRYLLFLFVRTISIINWLNPHIRCISVINCLLHFKYHLAKSPWLMLNSKAH
jgi:hypothetical protein